MTASPSPSSTALSVSTPAWTAGIYGQLDAARPVAELLAKSEMVPKGFQGKPMDILIAGAMGARLGLDLFSSLSGIAVVNGRATLWGDALLAVCQQHPAWEDYQQEITGEGDAQQAVVTVKRKGRSPHTETFSVADAKRAGLWGKQGPWTQHPKRMMALRARAFALRTVFADALAGFHAKEEMDDEPREVEAVVHPEPKPARRRTIETTAAPAAVDPAPVETRTDTGAATAAGSTDPAVGQDAASAAAPAKDLSVAMCQAEFGKLWKANNAKAREILNGWQISKVSELAAVGDDDREAFLLAVGAALDAATGA